MTKKQELLKEQKRNKHLVKMLTKEREKVAGYEQLAKVHSAYIAILLKKLGADKEHTVAIRAEDVAEALKHCEARALSGDNGMWELYYEVVKG